jgi:hypothetical protein
MVWAVVVVLALGGCATSPDVPPPEDAESMNPPRVLYEAIVSTYQTRDIPIALSSPKYLLVTSEYETVEPGLRKRVASRVIGAVPGAMGLKVTVEWQRQAEVDGEDTWRPIDTAELRKRARSEELELARAIERRYESWDVEWRAGQEQPE